MSRTILGSAILIAIFGVLAPLGAEEARPAILTGGSFEVETVKDLPYYEGSDADPVKHKLDLYLPKGKKDFPVLFFVHGGAWKSGDKKIYGPIGAVFAKNGVGMVVTNYRLSPGVKHPAHVQDVAKAFAWTVANIGKHGGKVSDLFISGHSAGGHLVALLATDESHLQAEKLTVASIKGVMALSGVYVIKPIAGAEKAFGSDEEVCKLASPLTHVKDKEPPFLIAYADKDFPTFDLMSKMMCDALKAKKCEADVLKIDDRTHVSIMVNVAREEDPLTQAMLQFIAKHSDLKLTAK